MALEQKPPVSMDPSEVESTCKSCGRYIGPMVSCPFCGEKMVRRSAITTTKFAALAIAVVGILLLHVFSMYFGTPPVDIVDMGETSNYAYVELRGVVVRTPVYYPGENGGAGTIYFTVDDGTGQISVRSYPRPVVEEMLRTGKVPGYGDRVKLVGNVYWYNAERGFILNSLDQLELTRPEPVNMSIEKIASLNPADMEGYYRVRTYGTVVSWSKYFSAVEITMGDSKENQFSLYVPNSVFDLTGVGVLGSLQVGMGLEIVGCLEYYEAGSYSKWEIIPATTADIALAEPDLAVTSLDTSPLAFPLSQQLWINATVENVGELPVSDAVVTISIGNTTAYTYTIPSLLAGDDYTVSYNTLITDLRTSLAVSVTVSAQFEDRNPSDNTVAIQRGG